MENQLIVEESESVSTKSDIDSNEKDVTELIPSTSYNDEQLRDTSTDSIEISVKSTIKPRLSPVNNETIVDAASSDSTMESSPRRDEEYSNLRDSSREESPNSNATDDDSEDKLLNYDPTPYHNSYPSPSWYSLKQLQVREYGKNVINSKNKRSTYYNADPFWFRRYAYESLYFIQRLELMEKLETHNGCVNCMNFNASGDLLCSGSDDLHVAIWDWKKGALKHKYHSGHTTNVFQCRWCLDGEYIATCARDGQVRMSNLRSSIGISCKLAQHQAPCHKLVISAPKALLSCGEDGYVYEIDLRADKLVKLVIVKDNERRIPLYSISMNSTFNPMQFAVCGRNRYVHIYDRRFLEPNSLTNHISPVLKICPDHLSESKHTVTSIAYNSVGTELLVSYNDEDMYVFNAKTGDKLHVYKGHRNSSTVKGCAWFSDNFVVSGSDDGYVYAWHKESEHIVTSMFADEDGVVNCIEPHPSTPILATSGLDDNVKIWVPSANQWPQTLKGIKQRICTNMKERRVDHQRIDDGMDDNEAMIWLLLRQLRQSRQRDDEETDDNDDADPDDEDNNDAAQCVSS